MSKHKSRAIRWWQSIKWPGHWMTQGGFVHQGRGGYWCARVDVYTKGGARLGSSFEGRFKRMRDAQNRVEELVKKRKKRVM